MATEPKNQRLAERHRQVLEVLVRRGDGVEHYETVRQRKDGRLIDVSLTVSPVRDAEGKIVGASKIARDITERKHSEAQMRVLARDICIGPNALATILGTAGCQGHARSGHRSSNATS
jgi:PAS domain